MATANRPVAKGGMFDSPKVALSKETRDLLKGISFILLTLGTDSLESVLMKMPFFFCFTVMMEESKLTNFQQRQLRTKADSMSPYS